MPRHKAIRPFEIHDADGNDTIIVYRVEHRDTHIGPYQHERDNVDNVMRVGDGRALYTHQPTAMLDIPGVRNWIQAQNIRDKYDPFLIEVLGYLNFERLRFGFYSLAALRAWFGDSFLALSRAGYVIGKYRVRAPGFLKGHNQVIYNIGDAVRIGELPYVDAMTNVPLLPAPSRRQTTLSV